MRSVSKGGGQPRCGPSATWLASPPEAALDPQAYLKLLHSVSKARLPQQLVNIDGCVDLCHIHIPPLAAELLRFFIICRHANLLLAISLVSAEEALVSEVLAVILGRTPPRSQNKHSVAPVCVATPFGAQCVQD